MKSLMNTKLALTALVSASLFAAGQTAEAGHYCHLQPEPVVVCHVQPEPVCRLVKVKTFKIIERPCVEYVTKYDHCGYPYRVKVVTYEQVKVPVIKTVKVCY